MSTYANAKELSKLTLGKTTQYIDTYSPDVLQAVPRSLNRDSLFIKQDNLPFYGEDVWYGYELSWLNNKGKPIVAVAEFRIPCTTPNIIESKSFKLYLNSLNQSKFASRQEVENILTKDLSATAGADISVLLFSVDDCPSLAIESPNYICIDGCDITVNTYDFSAEYLKGSQQSENTAKQYNIVSHLLKSNCLITNQPDWATIYIDYCGAEISQEALLQYIISFRQHNEFHEQCVERIYNDIREHCDVSSLTVFARYTRRGGLDINPLRSTENKSAPNARTLRQ